jgi:hypothetical protein
MVEVRDVCEVWRGAPGGREGLLDALARREEDNVAGAVAQEDGSQTAVVLADAVHAHLEKGVGGVSEMEEIMF